MSARWLRPSIFQHFEIILLPYKPPHGRVHLVHIDRNGGFNIPRVVQFIGNGIAISFHILFPVSTPKAHSETSVLKINSHLPAPTTNYPYSTIWPSIYACPTCDAVRRNAYTGICPTTHITSIVSIHRDRHVEGLTETGLDLQHTRAMRMGPREDKQTHIPAGPSYIKYTGQQVLFDLRRLLSTRNIPGFLAWQSAQRSFPGTVLINSCKALSFRACWRLLRAEAIVEWWHREEGE